MEYAGILNEKKPNQARILKNMIFQQGKETEILDKLKIILDKSS